jgi:hypothetical protein
MGRPKSEPVNVQRAAGWFVFAVAAVLAGCGAGGSSAPPVAAGGGAHPSPSPSATASATPTASPTAAGVLQLNVGTANLFGDTPAAAVIGTNVVVTYRQAAGEFAGNSAALVDSVTLTFPHALSGAAGTADHFFATITGGPAPLEIGHDAMTSTAQTSGTAAVTTFGTDGGAFGLGLEPFNVNPATGVPDNVVPYPVPLYDAFVAGGSADTDSFIPGGGPPAFSVAGNSAAALAGFKAISEGLDVFEIAPVIGTYSLAVTVAENTGPVTQSASAPLSSTAILSAVAPAVPTVSVEGGLSLAYQLPAGVTEAYLEIVDRGPRSIGDMSCLGATASVPVYYTIQVTTSGTATLADGSLCTSAQNTAVSGSPSDGDEFTVQTVGFDYPAYEASYPNSLGHPAPSLNGVGATHQADITVSSQAIYIQPFGGGLDRVQTKRRR